MNSSLLFCVIHKEQWHSFQLPKYNTVDDVKKEVYKQFGIIPHMQVIEGWASLPENNKTVLLNCCMENDCNNLVVYNTREIYEFAIFTNEDSAPNREKKEVTEICAVKSFTSYFHANFDKSGINFLTLTLEDAISRITFTDNPHLLLLYFHNSTHTFARTFCEILQESEVKAFLNENVFILAWDIQNDEYEGVLCETLAQRRELDRYQSFIRSKKCAALVVAPDGNSLVVSNMTERISTENFMDALNQAGEFLKKRKQFKEENTNEAGAITDGHMKRTPENHEGTEIEACLSFSSFLSANFQQLSNVCTLKESLDKRQVLLLYLHNRSDIFSHTFCTLLTQVQVKSILKQNFVFLGWDVSDDQYEAALCKSLENHNEMSRFKRFIKLKICAALIIIPVGGSLKLMSVIKDSIELDSFLRVLKSSEEYLIQQIAAEEDLSKCTKQEHTLGSYEYQQLMLDMLGDRDYDSFDHNEHEHLKNKIAYAFYGPPPSTDGYDSKQKEKIDYLFNIIVTESNHVTKWKDRVIVSFIYVCTEPLPDEKQKRAKGYHDYNPKADFTPFPVIVVRKCKASPTPCRIFIDDNGRVYQSWRDYLFDNKFPECTMICPLNGRYQSDSSGNVLLDTQLSPACSVTSTIFNVADITSTIGGVAAGGLFVAATAFPVLAAAPFVLPAAAVMGAAAGIYSLGRSVYSLYDRMIHNESISFWDSRESRGAYINLVAGALGFFGAGANMAVSRLAANGINIGNGATATLEAMNLANIGVSGFGVLNSTYDVFTQWWHDNQTPSYLTLIQLSSSILFFGQAVYNYRSAGSIIEESQSRSLQDYQESLRSNRHRKAFNKLMKETIRQNNGNVQAGRAEVISTIHNIKNKDDVFATLVRSNRQMNRNNVRFAASNGEITMNGVRIDMATFGKMEKTQVITFLTKLPNKPNPNQPNVRAMTITVRNSFTGISDINIKTLAMGLVNILGNTKASIQQKIISALKKLLEFLRHHNDDFESYMRKLEEMYPKNETYFRLVGMVNKFFQTLVNDVEERFQKEKKSGHFSETYFKNMPNDFETRSMEIFEIVSKCYFDGNELNQYGIDKLVDYFRTWFARELYLYEKRQERRTTRRQHCQIRAAQLSCLTCGGYHYAGFR